MSLFFNKVKPGRIKLINGEMWATVLIYEGVTSKCVFTLSMTKATISEWLTLESINYNYW